MNRRSAVRNEVGESMNSHDQSTDAFRPQSIWTIIVEHPLWIIGFSFFAFILLINIPINLGTSPFQKPAADVKTTQNTERLTMAASGAASIKRAMRDPNSFKLNSALINDKTGAVCYEFRSANGLNGMNVGRAVLSPKGVLKTSEMSGFPSLWNRECAHKEGTENVTGVEKLMNVAPE